ncbi:NRDE family protein [Shewanella sp. SR43-4]|uniref:NRDE family protein n=1 Tax=Shewanella sp. SR43-4 TaxID=2760942 RepID=UPI0015F9EF4C|nr:NRDE family protein [Shewanella sp. SR43-4]MBB1319284.1 NRDE family protein [Shewanella sp. SR43-4]
MCILFIAVEAHPDYPLIICANRDEFHHRATEPAYRWPTHPAIIAGQDKQAGGTWLGINEQGQFAGITNIRSIELQNGVRSRGELVVDALTKQHVNSQWLAEHSVNYNPFNLVFEHHNQLFCFNSKTSTTTILEPGFHAVSNGALDDIWPKMAKGQQQLQTYIKQMQTPCIDQLLAIMRDTSQPKDQDLPQTGISLEWERLLSAIFIQHEEYGTRSTSIVLKHKSGNVQLTEVRYDGKARNLGTQHFSIN